MREPHKLRAWLCGIARNLIHNAQRRQKQEPTHAAATLDQTQSASASEPWPVEQTIRKEEEAILWNALARIPEAYREPLILFYRDQQSVESVARALDLNEDTVKQRLPRGHKVLHEEMLAFVEATLKRTNPGRVFTFGVLTALPVLTMSAKAATVSAAAAKGTVTAAGSTVVAVAGSLIGPVIGVLGAWFGVQASLNNARTPRERQFVVGHTKRMIVAALSVNLILFGYILAATHYWSSYPIIFACLGVTIPLAFVSFLFSAIWRYRAQFRRMREEERQLHPESFRWKDEASFFRECRTRQTVLGLPLVRFRSGCARGEKVQPAIDWIAIGDRAYGIFLQRVDSRRAAPAWVGRRSAWLRWAVPAWDYWQLAAPHLEE